MAAPQRNQLNRLCSSPETLEKSESILRLANAKMRPGSGFVVKNPVAIPAVCAYIASEELNTGEVSLQSAMAAACVSKNEFTDILKKVRAALSTRNQPHGITDPTYATLVDAYRVRDGTHAIGCMEDAETLLPNVALLRERYGGHVVSCAVFSWVCQLMEEPAVQERSLRQAYSVDAKAFKAIVAMLDKRCDVIADQIKNHLRSPSNTAVRPRTEASEKAAGSSPKKRASRAPFPETPTKKRRVDFASPVKPKTNASPAKPPAADAIAAFHAALQGSPTKLPIASPSTPRRPYRTEVDNATTSVQANSQPSPTHSQVQTSPTRRRFRPVFLEQQQWCARDPKVDRMWAIAETLRDQMVELHGHPFEGLVMR